MFHARTLRRTRAARRRGPRDDELRAQHLAERGAPVGARLFCGITVLWIGLGALADSLTAIVLPAHVDAAVPDAGRASALGAVSTLGLVLAVAVQPVAGLASDRLRHRLGRRGWTVLSVVVALAALAGLGAASSLLAIAVAYALVQLAISSAQAGQQAFIPDLVPTARRGAAAGLKGLADVGGASIGFAVTGMLVERSGPDAALLFAGGLLALTCLAAVLLVREPRPARAEPSEPWKLRLASPFRVQLPRDAAFVRLVAARFAFLLGVFGVGRFFLFFVEDRFGMGAGEAGALLGLFAFVSLAASPVAGRLADRHGRLPVMRAAVLLAAAGVVALVPAGPIALLLAGGGLMAVGSAAFTAANWAATTDVVPPPDAARLMGLANVGTGGAAAAAGLLGPVVDAGNGMADGAGYVALFAVAVAGFAASAVLVRRVSEPEVGSIRVRWRAATLP